MLKKCVKGLADACAFFDVPVVGGNVSLYNEHGEGAIDPTPVVSMVGLIDKEEQVTRSQIKENDLELILLGGWPDELGGSYYLQTQFSKKEGTVPEVNLESEKKLQDFLISQIESGRIRAAHDVSEGGLLVCLAEMLFSGEGFGASFEISHEASTSRLDALLFGESQGRVVIAVNSVDVESLEMAAQNGGIPIHSLGRSNNSGDMKVSVDGNEILSSRVEDLRSNWEHAIPSKMESSNR